MADELPKLRERVRQNRTAREGDLVTSRAGNAQGDALPGGAFRVGDHVFDPETGQDGEVIGGTRENIVLPTPQR